MAIFSSKDKQLSTAQVIAQAIANSKREGALKDMRIEVALAAIIQEGSLPNTTVEQIGNTVFITHFSKDKSEVHMRALNVDSARNYLDNSVQYIKRIDKMGVVRLTSDFSDKRIVQLFKSIANQPQFRHWGMRIFKLSNGNMRAFVVMPKE